MLFDQFSRYRGLALACKAIDSSIFSPFIDGTHIDQEKNGKEKTIYDIGSGPYKLLGEFLPHNHISYVDPLLNKDEEEKDKESVYSIDIFNDFNTIKDNPKDIVVCIDTYEHIQAELRSDFLHKLVHLAKESIIMGFPYKDNKMPESVDNHVNAFFKSHFGEDYSWLKEHYEYGLPVASDTISFFKENGFHVTYFYQGNCDWLKKLLPTIIALNEFDFLAPLTEKYSEYFNKELAPHDYSEDAYRIFIIATKKEFTLGSVPIPSTEEIKRLTARVDQINHELIESALLPTLGILRNTKREMIHIERRSVEMGEWGQSLYNNLSQLQKDHVDLQTKSHEVSTWAKSLQNKVQELETQIESKQK